MKKLDPKTDGRSPDLVAENVVRLKELFPDAFTEGKVDFDALRQILGDHADDRPERYGLNWSGKSRARQIAQTPSRGTLRPAREESVEWDTTQNVFIEGDNLEVLKLLQKSYHRRVTMIYIDPPYNTGKEFVYPDRYQDNLDTYLRYTGQVDGEGLKVTPNAETSGRYHTNWLNMMYPRLKLARNLLRDDGVIFVSIDDHEAPNLRHVLDEVFGSENFICQMVWKKGGTGKNDTRFLIVEHEYILAYARDIDLAMFSNDPEATVTTSYNREDEKGRYSLVRLDSKTIGYSPTLDFAIVGPDGNSYWPEQPNGRAHVARWRWSKAKVDAEHGSLVFERGFVYTKNYESKGAKARSLLANERFGVTRTGRAEAEHALGEAGVFDFPKPVRLIRHLLRIADARDAIVLDFFAGSGTTGHAVMAQNAADGGHARYILVQLPQSLHPTDKDQQAAAEFCAKLNKPLRLTEVAKERLRGAARSIRDECTMLAGDLGFRVFKLDSTNIKPWDGDFDNLEPNLLAAVDNIKHGRSEDDVLYELLLKYGLDLSLPIEERRVEGERVFLLGAGAVVVCLASDITLSVVDGIGALKEELNPAVMRVVFRDASFRDDVVKTNAMEILKRAGIDDIKSL